MAYVQIVFQKRLSVDFTASLNLEPAAVTIFSHNWDPVRLSQAKENPVSVVTEFAFDPASHDQCIELLREVRLIYLRNGARDWHLYEDFARSNRFQVEVTAPSWIEYQRLHERLTHDEKEGPTNFAVCTVTTIRPGNSFVSLSQSGCPDLASAPELCLRGSGCRNLASGVCE